MGLLAEQHIGPLFSTATLPRRAGSLNIGTISTKSRIASAAPVSLALALFPAAFRTEAIVPRAALELSDGARLPSQRWAPCTVFQRCAFQRCGFALKEAIVDFAELSLDFERVRCAIAGSFLVRKLGGSAVFEIGATELTSRRDSAATTLAAIDGAAALMFGQNSLTSARVQSPDYHQ